MNGWGDDVDEMPTQRLIDDDAAEALLRGLAVPPDLEPLAGMVQAIRSVAICPVPPSPELAERMASGDFATSPVERRTRTGQTLSKFAALSLRAKVVTGLAATMSGLTAATAAGALPDAAQARVETTIESITPIDFPDRAEFGREIAEDAQDGGVDGQEISETARDQDRQPADRVERGSAEAHRPADAPGGPPTLVPIPEQANVPDDVPVPADPNGDPPAANPMEPPGPS